MKGDDAVVERRRGKSVDRGTEITWYMAQGGVGSALYRSIPAWHENVVLDFVLRAAPALLWI